MIGYHRRTMWPTTVKQSVLEACGRHCCICHEFVGRDIELHHIKPEADGGLSSVENCIALCYNCHAEVGHYNPLHPKGTKYSPSELVVRRDAWYRERQLGVSAKALASVDNTVVANQRVELRGTFVPRRFAVPPFFDDPDIEGNPHAVYWMLALKHPATYQAEYAKGVLATVQLAGMEDGKYERYRHLLGVPVVVKGAIWTPHTAHHHGDAVVSVETIEPDDL